MQEILDTVKTLLQASGGSMAYRDLYQALPDAQRRNLRNALMLGKQQGVIVRENIYDTENHTFDFRVRLVA